MNFFQLLRVHFLVVSALENFEPEDRLSVSSSPSSSFWSPLLSLLFLFRSCCCHEGADHDQWTMWSRCWEACSRDSGFCSFSSTRRLPPGQHSHHDPDPDHDDGDDEADDSRHEDADDMNAFLPGAVQGVGWTELANWTSSLSPEVSLPSSICCCICICICIFPQVKDSTRLLACDPHVRIVFWNHQLFQKMHAVFVFVSLLVFY